MPCAVNSPGAFAFLVVPYERTTTFVRGAAQGPEFLVRDWERLRKARQVPPPAEVVVLPGEALPGPRALVKAVRNSTERLLREGALPVLLGGEHTCTLGAVDALARRHGRLGVVQFDAHADLRQSYQGSRFNHACVMRRLSQDRGLPLLPLGIRAFSRSEAAYMRAHSIEALPGHRLRRWREVLPRLLERMPDRVYLTVDMDFFASAVAPGVGTPEPGGGEWYEALGMIDCILARREVVGFDVVELCPLREGRVSIRAAARLVQYLVERVSSG